MDAHINDFPTTDESAIDWELEQRYWEQIRAADDYANYVEACALAAAEEVEDAYDDEPEPPTPAAPAIAIVTPLFRCATCRDTGRVVKPSAFFAGRTTEGFCPDCTPHFDFAARRFIRPAA